MQNLKNKSDLIKFDKIILYVKINIRSHRYKSMKKIFPSLLNEFSSSNKLSDQNFLDIHESIPWFGEDYEIPEEYIAILKNHLKNEGDGGEFTMGDKISIFMRQNELNDNEILDLHGSVYWEYSSEEGINGMLKELKSAVRASNKNDPSY